MSEVMIDETAFQAAAKACADGPVHSLRAAIEAYLAAMPEQVEVSSDTLEGFLDLIGFKNHCCGCGNDQYDLETPFTAVIAAQPPKAPEEKA